MGKDEETKVTAYGDERARDGQIIDVPTSNPLYTVEHRYRKPTFTLKSASGDRVLATVCSSKWTMSMDMNVHGTEFEAKPKSKLGCTCTYPSPAFHGQTLTWLHSPDGGYL